MSDTPSPALPGGGSAFATLRHRDFRYLWIGQLVSGTGDQMQIVATAWHVYILTDSPLQVGILGLLRAIPYMAAALLGGAAIDTFDRKRLLLVSQMVEMAATVVLMVTTATGTVNVWVLFAVTIVSGAASAMDTPTRQALVPSLVPREELGPATSLLTILAKTIMLTGPAVGGVLIGQFGLAVTYGANAASSLAVVAALAAMRPIPAMQSVAGSYWERMRSGLGFARTEPLVLLPMLLDFLATALGSTRGFLPVLARDVFVVGPEGLGFLVAAQSAGAVIGGVALGSIRQSNHPVPLMLVGQAARGLLMVGLGLTGSYPLALALQFAMGGANILENISRAVLIQSRTPDELRGRVTALSSFFSGGGPYIGQLQSGAAAELMGPGYASIFGGVATFVSVVGFAAAPAFRREMAPAPGGDRGSS